jgi:hypothetical protein
MSRPFVQEDVDETERLTEGFGKLAQEKNCGVVIAAATHVLLAAVLSLDDDRRDLRLEQLSQLFTDLRSMDLSAAEWRTEIGTHLQ